MSLHGSLLVATLFVASVASSPAAAFQQIADWTLPQQQQLQLAQPQLAQQLAAPGQQLVDPQQRAPISAELQNQVQALSAQLAAANRQLQFYQQQLSAAGQPQASPALTGEPVNLPLNQQQQQAQQAQQAQQLQLLNQAALLQQQQQQQQQPDLAQRFNLGDLQSLQRQTDFAQQLLAQQQQQQQQLQQQQQQAPQVSTLVDDGTPRASQLLDPRLAGQQQTFFQQQQQAQAAAAQAQLEAPSLSSFAGQQAAPQQPTSTTMGPVSLEPSLLGQPQQAQPQAQPSQPAPLPPAPQPAPQAGQAMSSVHNPAKNDDKFSIGLGVLSPGYTQKFGNTALDFNQDKDGFSFTLSNNGHNNQPPKTPTAPAAAATGSRA